jgi:hypothetical protein
MTVTKALKFQFNWKPERLLALEEACVAGNHCELTSLNLSLAAMLGVVVLAMTGNAYAAQRQHPIGDDGGSLPIERPKLQASGFGHGASDLKRTVWWRAGLDRGIDPYLLYAVALTESARVFNDTVAPWPWALNRKGETIYLNGREAAAAHVRSLLTAGHRSIDIGLMQVNLRWHGHRVQRAEDLLDPVTNLQVGADVLAESIASAPDDLALGVGRYHSWNDCTAAYRYGRKVLALANLIKRSQAW